MLIQLLEKQSPRALGAVMLLDDSGQYLLWSEASALPESFRQVLPRIPVGAAHGSCGTAVYRQAPVIVTDIATDPLWAAWQGLILGHGLAACASQPIRAASGQVLGTVALYFRECRAPEAPELQCLELAADLAAMALERTHLEAQLRQTESSLANVQRIAHVGLWERQLKDLNHRQRNPLKWSAEVFRIFGYAPGQVEVTGELFFNAVHPEDRDRIEATVTHAIHNHHPYQSEHRIRWLDGSERVVHEQAEIVCDSAGRPIKLVGTVQDITERREAEMILRRNEERYHLIAENSADIIWLLDVATLKFNFISPSVKRVRGYTPEEVLAQDLSATLTPESYQRVLDLIAHQKILLAANPNTPRVLTNEVCQPCKDGRVIFTEVVTTLLTDDQGRLVEILGVTRDITERKKAEETLRKLETQLRQAQKMEAVGQLAGGIAHDFNNILTIIIGNASLVTEDANLNAGTRELNEQIIEAARRAANLTRQLLTFSRQQVVQLKPLDLNEILGNVTTMLGRLLGEHIDLQCHYGTSLPFIEADAGMIEQIIINLAVNARDAMPKGGQLILSTRLLEVPDAPTPPNPAALSGQFVTLSVTDTGCGMDQATLDRLFEPFFTTKDIGKGTGLGLATVYGIVKQHHGWIEVSSQVNQGTTFRVFLPAMAVAPSAATASNEPTTLEQIKGHETILVVEDEPSLRFLIRSCLQRCGFRILDAANGVEALKVWESHREQIDLLLTDMVMPEGLSGFELAERLRKVKPDLRVLFSSGYSQQLLESQSHTLPRECFLPKPYNPATLAQTVRQRLDAA